MDLVPWAVGGAVVALSLFLMWTHVTSWKKEQQDCDIDDVERPWFYRRFRRRMQTSGMLLAIGVLIPIGDQFLPVRERPMFWAVYWLLILIGLLWVVLLAVGDIASTSTHSRVATSRGKSKRRELEEELQRAKADIARRNGSH